MKKRTEDEFFEVIGPWVEKVRLKTDISQSQLVNSVKMSKSTYQKIKKRTCAD